MGRNAYFQSQIIRLCLFCSSEERNKGFKENVFTSRILGHKFQNAVTLVTKYPLTLKIAVPDFLILSCVIFVIYPTKILHRRLEQEVLYFASVMS